MFRVLRCGFYLRLDLRMVVLAEKTDTGSLMNGEIIR
jgi:hypothetical protein